MFQLIPQFFQGLALANLLASQSNTLLLNDSDFGAQGSFVFPQHVRDGSWLDRMTSTGCADLRCRISERWCSMGPEMGLERVAGIKASI
jgi:hypothetical protein